MAHPEPQPVTDAHGTMQRPQAQVAREAALREVAETLRNIEQAIRRAHHAERAVRAAGEPGLQKALIAAAEQLQAARKELVQSTYFGTDDLHLF